MKVVAIGGSPRLKGHTSYLIDQALAELTTLGVDTEKIILNTHTIGPCQAHNGCASFTECKLKDDAAGIMEKFCQADGVILASPVYFGSLSAQMKTFMDRTFFLFMHGIKMKAKCAGLIAIAGRAGAEETLNELNKFVRRVPDIKLLKLAGNSGSPDIDPKNLTELVEQARAMGRQMANLLTSIKK
ncbi:MAG: flavodoxin family protein [Desulfobacteraceae bacterium]|nr:flavodoxin family protein [Desulfobacteraceae bacterium]MBU4053253.1 flavodoxin family protein [Pseudomonadota bacterium]